MLTGGNWSDFMEETLKEILRTLKDYGQILKHIDGRFDTMEATIEMIRQNQISINQREHALELQCQDHHAKIDQTIASLARRISALEKQFTPIPRPMTEFCEEGG